MTYVIFDVLAHRSQSVMEAPYTERRRILEALGLNGPGYWTAEKFEDGESLFTAVVRQGLEGIVAKPLASRYVPGEPGWFKVKNRAYWRFGQEREMAHRRRTW